MIESSSQEGVESGRQHLILGGCGFIGMAVARQLVGMGADVVLADRVAPAGQLPARMRFVPFELATADWNALIGEMDVVHHYAWSTIPATANADPAADLAENVGATVKLLEALRRLGPAAPRLVFASSGGTVYGKLQHVPVQEDHPLQPITAYGVGKASAELYISQYRANYGLDCRIARLSNPFGAGQNVAKGQGAVTVFLQRAIDASLIEIWGNGEVVRDYIHISDTAAGLVAVARATLDDKPFVFNIGSGHGVSLNGVVHELERQLDRPVAVKRSDGRVFDIPVSILDVGLASKVLGWRPRLSFAEGLSQTLQQVAPRSDHAEKP